MRVRSCCEVWGTVFAKSDDTDADQVWKGSSANEDSKQQPADATGDEASLLEGVPAKQFLLPPQDADILQALTPPLNP